MAKYSFEEECDNLDRLAREMRENLQLVHIDEAYRTVRKISALAARLNRKLVKYEDYYDRSCYMFDALGDPVHIKKPLDDDCWI